jgi:hypothetical protein
MPGGRLYGFHPYQGSAHRAREMSSAVKLSSGRAPDLAHEALSAYPDMQRFFAAGHRSMTCSTDWRVVTGRVDYAGRWQFQESR